MLHAVVRSVFHFAFSMLNSLLAFLFRTLMVTSQQSPELDIACEVQGILGCYLGFY